MFHHHKQSILPVLESFQLQNQEDRAQRFDTYTQPDNDHEPRTPEGPPGDQELTNTPKGTKKGSSCCCGEGVMETHKRVFFYGMQSTGQFLNHWCRMPYNKSKTLKAEAKAVKGKGKGNKEVMWLRATKSTPTSSTTSQNWSSATNAEATRWQTEFPS